MSRKENGRRGVLLSVSLLSGIGLLLAAQASVGALMNASYFTVDRLALIWPKEENHPPERYRLRPEVSIFQADLKKIAQVLAGMKPFEEVDAVRRVLPNRIVATMKTKRAVAQVKADRYYPVSDEGRLLLAGQPGPWPHLPILVLEGGPSRYRAGETIQHPGFGVAAELLERLRRQGSIAGHPVSHLRLRGQEAILVLGSGLEVRFSADRLEQGWLRWADLAAQRPELLDRAQYLDFRFGDPVIGGVPEPKNRKPRDPAPPGVR